MGWLNQSTGEYNGGDQQPFEVEVPDRPSAAHRWEGAAWVLDGALIAPQVRSERDRLLQEARLRMGPLRDAVELGVATPEESALLLQWKQYRIDLGRIEQQASYPITVAWPVMPQ